MDIAFPTASKHGYEMLKHAFVMSVGPENYGVIRNGKVVERHETSFGESFGLAFRSMIAAGPSSYVVYSERVPVTWWDHLKHDLLAMLRVAPPLYDTDDLDGDELAAGRQGTLIGPRWKKVAWRLLGYQTRSIATQEEHKHLCPHVDIDFKENPAPHYEWLLSQVEQREATDG